MLIKQCPPCRKKVVQVMAISYIFLYSPNSFYGCGLWILKIIWWWETRWLRRLKMACVAFTWGLCTSFRCCCFWWLLSCLNEMNWWNTKSPQNRPWFALLCKYIATHLQFVYFLAHKNIPNPLPFTGVRYICGSVTLFVISLSSASFSF